MHFEISLAGDVQVSRKLLRIGDRAVHAKPAFEAIANVLMGIERRQFESEGRRSSGGWAELKQSTIDAKGDESILFDSGSLMSSLSEDGDEKMTKWATDEFLLFGSKLDYASYHQTGTSRMAQRRPLELRETDRAGMVKILQMHILGDGDSSAIAEVLLSRRGTARKGSSST